MNNAISLTTAQRLALHPVKENQLVFDTDLEKHFMFDGTAWRIAITLNSNRHTVINLDKVYTSGGVVSSTEVVDHPKAVKKLSEAKENFYKAWKAIQEENPYIRINLHVD